MTGNPRLNGCIDQIELGFVEREATPQLLMKIDIQLHLAGLSLSNTVSILEVFGVERACSTVHNWVHKADLQPKDWRSPDHVAVGETMIRLGDERYWLYAAVDPELNDLLHTKLEPVRTNVFAHMFFAELREKHDADDVPRNAMRFWCANETRCVSLMPCFSSMARHHSKMRAFGTASISDTNATEIGIALSVSLER